VVYCWYTIPGTPSTLSVYINTCVLHMLGFAGYLHNARAGVRSQGLGRTHLDTHLLTDLQALSSFHTHGYLHNDVSERSIMVEEGTGKVQLLYLSSDWTPCTALGT
jgi:hypothetical protein